MHHDQIFQFASLPMAFGWVLLCVGLLGPVRWQSLALTVGGRVMPLLLCVGYVIVLASSRGAPGGFGSLSEVSLLFSSKGPLLAGWIHFLAFDLLVGRWQVDKVLAVGRPWLLRLLTVLCLFATLMFGPMGLLLFLVVFKLSERSHVAVGQVR
ncbi:MAG: DUF4281 domain-containing protein [Burkholderiales bacterium]|nr:DUF4281 domain-containing protein [Burkholderiales bacterium]